MDGGIEVEKAVGVPLLEVDDWVRGTYCVVSVRFGTGYVYRFNQEMSCNIFHCTDKIRTAATFCITHLYFDIFMLIVILANCVTLAIEYDALYVDILFTTIYCLEMVVCIIARGFVVGHFTYLRSPWRLLDFVLNIIGVVTIILMMADILIIYIYELKSLRALRVLKAIAMVPGFRLIVNVMLQTIKSMYDVALLMVFFLIVFSIIGKEVFSGILLTRCVMENITWTLDNIRNKSNWLQGVNGQYFLCTNLSERRQCPSGYVCMKDFGFRFYEVPTNFDSFPAAMLGSFRIVTQDSWHSLYRQITSTFGWASVLFFSPLVFFGTFILLNVMLAVVAKSYQTVMNEESRGQNKDLEKYREHEIFTFNLEQLTLIKLVDIGRRSKSWTFEGRAGVPSAEDIIEEIQHEMRKSQDAAHLMLDTTDRISETYREGSKAEQLLTWYKSFRLRCLIIVYNPIFLSIKFFSIIGGTMLLACEYHGMPRTLSDILDYCNWVLIVINAFEQILLLIGHGFSYFRSGWRVFDGLIVLASILEILIMAFLRFSVFRTLRLMRLAKLAGSFSVTKKVLTVIITTLVSMGELSFVFIATIYVFAIVGMRLLGGHYRSTTDKNLMRWNFIDFNHSLLAVLRILCGEWTDGIFECLSLIDSHELSCYILIIPYFLIGNFILLNLYIAVLLNAFGSETLEEELEDEVEPEEVVHTVEAFKRKLAGVLMKREKLKDISTIGFVQEIQREKMTDDFYEDGTLIQTERSLTHAERPVTQTGRTSLLSAESTEPRSGLKFWRRRCEKMIQTNYFEGAVLVIIIAGTIPLCLNSDVYAENSPLRSFLDKFDILIVTLHIIETVLRLFAYGFREFFTEGWLIIDFTAVVFSLLGLFVDKVLNVRLSSIRGIRVIRVVKFLRYLARWSGMQVVIEAFLLSSKSVLKVLLVCIFIWLAFAILGVQLFSGRFYHCVDENNFPLSATKVDNRTDCLEQNYTWKGKRINFDHVGNSYVALLHIAFFSNWKEIVADAVDGRGVDYQPVYESRFATYIYFVLFVIIGSLITINLLTGNVIDNFNAMKKQVESEVMADLQSDLHHDYYLNMLKILEIRPKKTIIPPKHKFLFICYKMCISKRMTKAVALIVSIHTFVYMLEHETQPDGLTSFVRFAEGIFLFLYTVEATIKFCGLRKRYFNNVLNYFDFGILILSHGDFILRGLGYSNIPRLTVAAVFRLVYVIIALEQARGRVSLKNLVNAVFSAAPSLLNICILMFLIMFIYAVLGLASFGAVRGKTFDDVTNFRTFLSTFLILLHLITTSGWENILENLSVEPPDCDKEIKDSLVGDCGLPILAIIYIISYLLVTNIILLNMYVAVVLEYHARATSPETEIITHDDLQEFYEEWSKYDNNLSHFIPLKILPKFLDSLPDRIRVRIPNSVAIASMEIPILEGERVHIVNVLIGLMKIRAKDSNQSKAISITHRGLRGMFRKVFKRLDKYPVIDNTMAARKRHMAARTIQKNFKKYKEAGKVRRVLKSVKPEDIKYIVKWLFGDHTA